MKKLEMKDLTEAEKAEITLLLQKAQAHADHTLTNGERNKIREEGRLKIAEDRAKVKGGRVIVESASTVDVTANGPVSITGAVVKLNA